MVPFQLLTSQQHDMFETLQRGWNKNLINIFQTVQTELTISSPYISDIGAEFLLTNVSNNFKREWDFKVCN